MAASARAFPAEVREEERIERGPIDDPTDDPPIPFQGTEMPEAEEQEREQIDQLILPGMTDGQQECRRAWLKIPRAAR